MSELVMGDPRKRYDPVYNVNVGGIISIHKPVELNLLECSHQVKLFNIHGEKEHVYALDLVTKANR